MRRETVPDSRRLGAAVRKAREPNDKLDRAMDKTLVEADRKALHGLCR